MRPTQIADDSHGTSTLQALKPQGSLQFELIGEASRAVTATPEFLRWALERRCELRENRRWRNPEQTERQLRPLRAYSEAIADDRLFEGVCVARSVTAATEIAENVQPKGFMAEEILSAYGGLRHLQTLCGFCEANALRAIDESALAGCYGLFEVSGLENELHTCVEHVIDIRGWQLDFAQTFFPTTPRWYGLWVQSPLEHTQLLRLRQLFAAVAHENRELGAKFRHLSAALCLAVEKKMNLHVELIARGRVKGTKWTVEAHCSRCRATDSGGSKGCTVCGHNGEGRPARERNVRGERPYWRLSGFLGGENVVPFLQRYRQYRNGCDDSENG